MPDQIQHLFYPQSFLKDFSVAKPKPAVENNSFNSSVNNTLISNSSSPIIIKTIMRIVFSFLISAFTLFGCKQSDHDNSNIYSIKVIFNDAEVIIDTTLIDYNSMKYIPLINTDGIVGEVSQLIVDSKLFLLLDKQQKCVWKFDQNGQYQKKLCKFGRGPGEYPEIAHFIYNFNSKQTANYEGIVWQGLSSAFNHPLASDGEYFYSIIYPHHFSDKGKDGLEKEGIIIDDNICILKFKYKI